MHLPARQTKMRWPQCGDKHTKAGQSAAKVVFGKKTLVSEVILPLRMVTRDGSGSRASEAYFLHETQGSRGSYWIGVTSRSSPEYLQVIKRLEEELEAQRITTLGETRSRREELVALARGTR